MKRAILLVTVMVMAVVAAFSGVALAQATSPNAERQPSSEGRVQPRGPAPGEILVKFRSDTTEQERAAAHQQNGGQVKDTIDGIDVQVVGVERGKEQTRANAYRQNSKVEFAELNGSYEALETYTVPPNDPRASGQWQFNNTGQTGGTSAADIYAFQAWNTTIGDATAPNGTAPIAILDTGIKNNPYHEDLPESKIIGEENFTDTASSGDVHGHGTHVAGSAAGATNNQVGVLGTCPGCPLLNVKVLDDGGSGYYSWIADGILWAAGCETKDQNGKCTGNGDGTPRADVINMSLGGTSRSSTLESAVNKAWDNGVVMVAAAGNSNTTRALYPAYYTNVIAVGATDASDKKASFSNYGSWVDVAAPGVGILSTTNDNGYASWNGTSMATPHVAGTAGLVWSTSLGTSNSAVRNQIESTADAPGKGTYWTYGRINACRAVVPSGTTCSTNRMDTYAPIVSSVSPRDGATRVSSTTSVKATFSEKVKTDSINNTTFTLLWGSDNNNDGKPDNQMDASVSLDSTGMTATLKPSRRLDSGKTYTATVKGGTDGVKDAADHTLTADYSWTFTIR